MNNNGYIYFLNALMASYFIILSRLYSKTDAHNFHNIIKIGWVIQGELTRSVLKISGVINCFYLLETLHFCLVHVHVYDTRC